MHSLGFKYMIKNPAILAPEKGTANAFAVSVLCAFALAQLLAVATTLWVPGAAATSEEPGTRLPATSPTAMPADALPSGPLPTGPLNLPALPNGMAMPSGGRPSLPTATLPQLPPLPVFTNPLPPSAAASVPPIRATQPPLSAASLPPPALPTAPISRALAPPPVPTPQPEAPTSRTGNPEIDSLIETAQQLRELRQHDQAAQTLERADLIAPDNALVLRELSVTYQLMGQADKAKAIQVRLQNLRGTGATGVPQQQGLSADAMRAMASRDAAAAQPVANGPLRLGAIEVLHDATFIKGQRLALRVPLIGAPGITIDPNVWRLDVFFYDQVNGVPAYPSIANAPVTTDDGACDFKQGGQEILKVIYELPELSPADVAEYGQRSYLGYVAKLYYQNKLMSQTADPVSLFNYRPSSTAPAR